MHLGVGVQPFGLDPDQRAESGQGVAGRAEPRGDSESIDGHGVDLRIGAGVIRFDHPAFARWCLHPGRDGRMPPWPSSRTSPGRWTAESRRSPCNSTTPIRPADGRAGCSPARTGRGPRPSPRGSGLARPAVEVDAEFDFWAFAVDHLTGGERIDYVVCDETQFYTAEQIDQLARLVDELEIDVFAFGILTDFQSRLFPGVAAAGRAERPDRAAAGPVAVLVRGAGHPQRPDDRRRDGGRGRAGAWSATPPAPARRRR